MDLSVQTSLLVFSLTSFFGLLLMVLIRFKFKLRRMSILYIFMFYLGGFIGPILIIFRQDLSVFVSVILANLILLLGNIFLYIGIHKIVDYKFKRIVPIIVSLLFLSLMVIFTYIHSDVVIRILVLNFSVSFLYFKIVIDLQIKKEKVSLVDEFLSLILILLLVGMVARILGVLFINESSNDFLKFTYDPFFLLVIGVLNLLIIAGILSTYYNDVSVDLKESERQMKSLISNLPGFAYRCKNDQFWSMEYLTDQFEVVTGWNKEDVLNNYKVSFIDLILESDTWKDRELYKLSHLNGPFQLQYKINRKEGGFKWVLEQGAPLFDENGRLTHFEGYVMDITHQKVAEEELQFLSYHDPLTKLYNRRFIDEKIDLLQNRGVYPITVIMGDINNLKYINDTFGHESGDKVIVLVSDVIRQVIGEQQFISRTGGDEFLILLENTDESQALKFTELIHKTLEKEQTKEIKPSIAIGYSVIQSKTKMIRDHIRFAEDKMYQCKVKYHKNH